ncbi:hypothetical protein AUC71_04350 [Methyloceanibacter marginalis]|uniref:Uncharacterized protein n=1 Tax=Methyloceanibacter marginalis TaxID=1774971 RepID=A0A1E3VU41_9HYPH|nr:hypothetical protein [Methyloceanibacter marginalis]ODR96801.1 hypothetical protein AUC71_04350 [Methyloceanibacter marginalis]
MDALIKTTRVEKLHLLSYSDPDGVAIVMPSLNVAKATETAKILLKRAGMTTTVFIVEDTVRQGFIKTLNDTAAQLRVRYLAYVAEDAFPGVDWLRSAHARLEETNRGLLAFNCGKWRGRIAAFGLVRLSWVKQLYGGPVFFPAYKAHKADNELTVIARVQDQLVYDPNCVLVEIDADKQFRETVPEDKPPFASVSVRAFPGSLRLTSYGPLLPSILCQWM